ncbi:tol-pal system-associated acyl-CoA thioesterase [Chelativorans sp. YIM 93263]|uniref:tol-pal system-associated acyl-CoA thioesterase n=1 Tax=Chelativorans sp. YIM 93263 TaxID=2906648 RepID=UPI0023790D57|nr:tol-pal system-associated acyl-CoA thioesterase [Chelativorans sp. YIM 93263]
MNQGLHEAAISAALTGELTETGHRLLARVYFADTDFTGVVYHARYLEFLERGRSDFLRLSGVHHSELADGSHGEKLAWVVRRMEIEFRRPARVDDIVAVETRVEDVSGARVFMDQELRHGEELLVSARVEAAIIGPSGKPRRMPAHWKNAFLRRSE